MKSFVHVTSTSLLLLCAVLLNSYKAFSKDFENQYFVNQSQQLVRINAADLGFLPKATAAANTIALQLISQRINGLGGGVVLSISKGNYIVGRETFASKGGKGFAYRGDTLLYIKGCTKPITIEGNGATISLTDGLHFGSFDARTGAVHRAASGGFYQSDYTAYPQVLLEFLNNKSVTVRNLILDGNMQGAVIGGYWGDTGIQLPADGILARDNEALSIEKVTARYFLRDGVQIANQTPDEKSSLKKVFLTDCLFDGNMRQGMSWVGGNHLIAIRCQFVNTGKTINRLSKAAVLSAPGAGIDMEAELGLIRNGVFTDCIIDNNAGAGLLLVGDVARIVYNSGKIIGATNWSIYGTGPNAIFNKTTVVGSPVNLRVGNGPLDPANSRFNNCLITMDSLLSPTGKVYGNYVMDFGGGAGGHFKACIIDSKNRGTVYGGSGCTFTDCTFKQNQTAVGYNGYPFMSGVFYGTNRWYKPGEGIMQANLDKSIFHGPFYVNDVKVADKR